MDNVTDVLHSYMEDRRAYYVEMMQARECAAEADHTNKFDVSELNEHYAYLESKKEILK